jgi:RNA polymerase sigma-70 factor (ECF subfamily)
MNRTPDESLISAIQQGDILAYGELVKRYQRGLFVFVMRIIHDEHAARDVVQETLVKVYQIIDRIDVQKKFSTFVFEIAKNQAISVLRSRKKNVSLEDIVDIEDDKHFLEELYRSDMARGVRKAVSELASKYRKVITLYYFDDLSYEEVSRKLDIPVNTVRTHLKRAKEQLKKILIYEK